VVEFRELSIPDAYLIRPVKREDGRGLFLEWFQTERFQEALGHEFVVRQANTSLSRRGVVRGIHYADIPPGQAKYVTVMSGAVIDYVIDLRVGSPTFGRWEAVPLDDVDRHAVYLAEGLGHAFVATTDSATVSYLVSDVYRPDSEHAINPLDTEIALELPRDIGELILSDKDTAAPSLADALKTGALPQWDAARALYDARRQGKGRNL